MRVLAVDTALDACQAALVEDGRVLGVRSEPMQRGHQERLAPLVEGLMSEAGAGFESLDRLGVTVGPGSFTGLRVGLAFVKGLSLALGVPCVGIGTLEALAAGASGRVAAVIDARRDRLYLQLFEAGRALSEPELLEAADAHGRIAQGGFGVVGPGAWLVTERADPGPLPAFPDPVALARLAAAAPAPSGKPAPLYLRAPDARTIAERAAGALG